MLEKFFLTPYPKCLPFCGKVLIDDVWSGGSKEDGKYPLMSYAIRQGLYHPRCKDSHTTYFPGISTADDTWTEEELDKIGLNAKMEAKQQYAKRQAEKYDRMAKNSLDKDNKRMYQSRAEQWENVATDGSKENLQQEVKITKKDKKNVNRDLVNSKEYHDRYEAIGMPKKGFESAYVEAKKILEKADGDDYEFLTVIDTKTGKTVATTLEYKKVHRDKVGFNESDYNKAYSYRGSITQIHNHSKNGRPSGADIISCFKHENVEYSIIACHDGDLFVLQDFNRKFDVEKIYDEYYNEAVREMQNLTDDEPIPTDISDAKKKACKIRATTKLYELNKTKKMFKITRYSNE